MVQFYNLSSNELSRRKKVSDVHALIIYDITNDKRRSRLAKVLNAYGSRIQKSAFEAFLTQNKYKKLNYFLTNFAEDDDEIRVYQIRRKNDVTVFGKNTSHDKNDFYFI